MLKQFLGLNSHGSDDKIPREKKTPTGFSKLPRDFTPFTVSCVKIIGYFLTKPYRNKSNGSVSLYKSG